jgi:hypothetical protein
MDHSSRANAICDAEGPSALQWLSGLHGCRAWGGLPSW